MSEPLQQDTWQERIRNLEEGNMDDLLEELYPEITLETDDIIMSLSIKKDYSKIEDSDKRKKEFISDLKDFIDEFAETPESDAFMRYYDD